MEDRIQQLEERNEELEALWEAKIDTRIRVEGLLQEVEAKLRIKKTRIDRMYYYYRVAFWRLRDRMEYHPAELGQTCYTISRDLVSYMISKEYNDAIRRNL